MIKIKCEEITVSQVKSKVLALMDWFNRTYYAQPRYVMLSEIQFQLLAYDMSLYLYQDFKREGIPHLFGMEVCVSERVKTLDDIEVF